MATLKIVRLQPRGAGDLFPTSVQLWLDEQRIPIAHGTTFGVLGNMAPAGEDKLSFLLFTEGKMDIGSEYKTGRYGQSNLYSDRQVTVGEMFTIDWDDDGKVTYQVEQITPLT
ncbi:MAG: hypothetical protein Q4G49_12080 [Paracoccus sp. (in: a-proteobacteria)]|nr:hypothetical protein [Paracoccus sp. (in: a-proteobacteria)]